MHIIYLNLRIRTKIKKRFVAFCVRYFLILSINYIDDDMAAFISPDDLGCRQVDAYALIRPVACPSPYP